MSKTKTCDYCKKQGVMPTFMDGETICHDCFSSMPMTGRECRQEIARLRADAARYRWLRKRDLDTIVKGGVFAGSTPDNVVLNGVDLDVEIDAAMKSPNSCSATCQDTSRIQQLQDDIAAWSDSTFGQDRPPIAPLSHLVKEIGELIDAPDDRMEYADCLMLLLDSYRLAGGSADDLVTACFQKLEINKQRRWGVPDVHGVVEHIRD